MELVLANAQLGAPGGSETYLLTVAEQLQRLGHEVTLFATTLGEAGQIGRARGLRVVDEARLPESCDVVLSQDGIVAFTLAERYPDAPQLFVAHSHRYDLQLPPRVAGVTDRVVVLNDRVHDRVAAAAGDARLVRLRQPIDIDRFSPRGVARRRARRVLALGNYLQGARLDALAAACDDLGLDLVRIGIPHGRSTLEPEVAIADADIVVGRGRVILEAMASARAAYVYDESGCDGWVTPDRYAAMEADGFNGNADGDPATADRLRAELAAYTQDMGEANRDLATAHHGAARHAEALSAHLAQLAPRAQAPPEAAREMARLVRHQWQADGLALGLASENRVLRERAAGLEAAHAEAIAEIERLRSEAAAAVASGADEIRVSGAARDGALEAFKRTRRYRVALALARPLDIVRALLGLRRRTAR